MSTNKKSDLTLTLTLKRVRRGLRTDVNTGGFDSPAAAGAAGAAGPVAEPVTLACPPPPPATGVCSIGLKKNFVIAGGYRSGRGG